MHRPVRDTSRRIIGYIERDGTMTNTSRQQVAEIELDQALEVQEGIEVG